MFDIKEEICVFTASEGIRRSTILTKKLQSKTYNVNSVEKINFQIEGNLVQPTSRFK